MSGEPPYSAFHLPGLSSTFDPNESIRLGAQWLAGADDVAPNGPLVVINATSMTDNARLRPLDGNRFVSPQSRRRPDTDGHAVLAVWVSERALILAEEFARGGALCLIPGIGYDAGNWMRRTHAGDLTDPERVPSGLEPLEPAVQKVLDYLLEFAGHNSFVGGDDKRTTVLELRALRNNDHRLDPELIAAHAAASALTDPAGVAQLREFVAGVNADRAYRDRSGKI